MRAAAFVFAACAALGCNQVLGIEPASLDAAVASNAQRCVLNSDCESAEVCIFRLCSPPCARDRDCAAGLSCLRTEDGAACVDPESSACEGDGDCPSGTSCSEGACRTRCDETDQAAQACLPGQACVRGGCRGEPAEADAGAGARAGAGAGADDAGMAGVGGDGALADAGEDASGADDGGATPARECEADQRRCMDGVLLQTCQSDGTWDDGAPCAYVCNADACTGECVPDDTQCSDNTLQRCDALGEWEDDRICPKVCTPAGCVDRCDPGEHQCSSLDLLVCNEVGEFELDRTCPYVCRAGACIGQCAPDDRQCASGDVEVCDADGEWTAGPSCEFVCIGDACGGQCVPDDTQCSDNTHVQTCSDDGQWGAAVACPYVCVAATGQCGGSCSPGDTQCSDNTHVQTCSGSGQWGSPSACQYVCVNATGTCGGSCSPGDTQCSDNTHVQTCSGSGQWGSPSACQYVCVDATGACGGECAPGTYTCLNSAPSTSESHYCDGGTLELADDCNYPSELCASGACAANTPYDVGFAAQLANSSSAGANLLLGIPIDIQRRVRVERFGLYGRAKAGIKVKMALYTDSGGAAGAPSTFLTSSDEADLTEGTIYLPLQIATTLNPGRYWLMAIYNGTGGNTYIASPGTGRAVYYAQGYLTPFPATLSSGGTALANYDLNHFLEVRNSL